jgi:hypothetical protein
MHKTLVSLMLLTLAGCATNPPPIVEMAGKDPVQVNRDMAECRDKPMPIFGPNGGLPPVFHKAAV